MSLKAALYAACLASAERLGQDKIKQMSWFGKNHMKVTVSWKGERRTKMWIVHLPDGTTRGFPAHLYTKDEAIAEVKNSEYYEKLIEDIMTRFSKTIDYLAKH
jgi:hypothetical protein